MWHVFNKTIRSLQHAATQVKQHLTHTEQAEKSQCM